MAGNYSSCWAQTQIEAQRKRVRFGEEEQQNERALTYKISRSKRYDACSDVEQGTGVEPASAAWEAAVLPMYEPCIFLTCLEGIIAEPFVKCNRNFSPA